MFEKLNRADETSGERLTSIPDDLLQADRPLIFHGASSESPFVIESRSAEDSLRKLLG